MISSEIKALAGVGTIVLGIFAIHAYEESQRQKHIMADKQKAREHELQLKEKEVGFPPEYWTAKAAEHEASVKKHEIDVQSQERLTIDQRNREDAERQAIREFEKDAPAEYWEQKRIKQEEETKRRQIQADEERARRLDERERDIARKNADAIAKAAKTAERIARSANYSNIALI